MLPVPGGLFGVEVAFDYADSLDRSWSSDYYAIIVDPSGDIIWRGIEQPILSGSGSVSTLKRGELHMWRQLFTMAPFSFHRFREHLCNRQLRSLIEALGWFRQFRDKTTVSKLGGKRFRRRRCPASHLDRYALHGNRRNAARRRARLKSPNWRSQMKVSTTAPRLAPAKRRCFREADHSTRS